MGCVWSHPPGIAGGAAPQLLFYVRDDYPVALREAVEGVYSTPGFFAGLPAIPGAVNAFRSMLDLGHDVRICTSPLNADRYCVGEKYEWVEKHLGLECVSRIIVTKDKTVVHGDLLIDDNPEVTGSRRPEWRHLVFDQPYNRQSQAPRISWRDWQAVLHAQR